MLYNNPNNTKSSIDVGNNGAGQLNTFFYQRKALVEAAKDMYFSPLADVTNMPKHYGKTIKVYHYMPLLDDRNVNDQGIDAAGVTISADDYMVTLRTEYSFAVEADATAAAAAINAIQGSAATKSGSATPWVVTVSDTTLVAATAAEVAALETALNKAVKRAGGAVMKVTRRSGNLYGSSKDVGTITSKLPTLSETGGRVNRVGFTRRTIEGTMTKFGFFTEFSQESLDFDTDEELYEHISREMVTGAVQISEAILQKDLLAGAGVILYAGAAVSKSTITGEGSVPSVVNYDDLSRLARILNDNRTPKQTKVIAGSRMTDTRTISSGRVIYIGSELESVVKGLEDPFENQAFIPVHKYADAANILNGEIGAVDQFRFVVVPEMQHYAGQGAAEDDENNLGYLATAGAYDVFPMLVVGDGSFTTIGFQIGGKAMKFKIITKMPGEKTADRQDPFGEMGFSSIKWFQGTMILRSERLAVILTAAPI